MAMIVCPHCGEQVSEKAKKCVHCGEILILEEKKHCTECGVELEEGMTECPNCGCPVDDTIGQETDEKPQKVEVTGVKVTKKIKVIIGIVIALLVVGGATVFGVTQYQKKKAAEEYAQRVEEYSDNLNLATVTMLTGASDAESSANLIKQVWYNAIYEKRDDETDKYTRPKGYFVSDFNDALGNLYADSSFSSKVSSIEDNQDENYVKVILSGEEQFDEQIILNFDGTVDMKPLPNTEVSEQENDTSVEYTTKPESIDLEELNQKNITEQVDKAKKAESWTMDESNGTMYFFLDEQNGWRLVVVDAAAGSRFYVMERTADGGDTWERINEDPFDNQAGVAEGVMFLDDNFGIAGLAGASQSHSTLYITKDGGRSFGEIKLPMSTVTELPESAKEYGFTVEDYDYLNMPQIGATTLIIMVTTDKGDNDGIVFESEDGGDTWKYRGVTQN